MPWLCLSLVSCGLGGRHAAEVQAIAGGCVGVPVVGAPAHVGGPGPHPILAVRQSPSGRWAQGFGMLTTRTPAGHDIATTQLVLCVDAPREVEVGLCSFDTQLRVGFVPVPGTRMSGPTFRRIRMEQPVRIVAAATAQVVGATVLTGTEPPPCDTSIVGHPGASDFRGGAIPDAAINQWAEPFGLGISAASPQAPAWPAASTPPSAAPQP